MSPHLKPLPDCEGPKLEPFTQDITAHDFEFLDIPHLDDRAVHSVIAKVKIDGQAYCLKMVRSKIQTHPSRGPVINN